MPGQAQYKTMGGRTAIDDILDLDDSNDRQTQVSKKYIRNTGPTRPVGIYGSGMQNGAPANTGQQMMAQEMISSMHPAHPRYAQHAMSDQVMQSGIQRHPSMQQGVPVVEDFKPITISDVASRVFSNVPEFIIALDDPENELHNVAKSFLSNDTLSSGDKTIYIIIIIILSIAIACLLYKLNQKC